MQHLLRLLGRYAVRHRDLAFSAARVVLQSRGKDGLRADRPERHQSFVLSQRLRPYRQPQRRQRVEPSQRLDDRVRFVQDGAQAGEGLPVAYVVLSVGQCVVVPKHLERSAEALKLVGPFKQAGERELLANERVVADEPAGLTGRLSIF